MIRAVISEGYYDGKREPDNFLHVFEGAMRMEKWAMPVTSLGTKPKTKGYGRALEKKRDKRDRFIPYKEPNHGILQNLTKGPREILVLEELGKMSVKPPKMVSKARDTSKYYEFHQDYGHDTTSCRELKNQIDKAVKSGKLDHFIKGIRKGMAKQTETQLGE
ncbi:hypothetical protein Tco_1452350 [Tanacetum coccineum]